MFYETITLTCFNRGGSKRTVVYKDIDESESLAQLQPSEEFILEFDSGMSVDARVIKRKENHGGYGLNMHIEVITLT